MASTAGLHERPDYGPPDFSKNSDLSQMSLQQAAAAAAAWQKTQGGPGKGGIAPPWASGSASSGWGGSNPGGLDRWGTGSTPGQTTESPHSTSQWENGGERDLSWNPSTAYFSQQDRAGGRKPGWSGSNW